MLTQLSDTIKQLARELSDDTVKIRRHIHAHPELSYEEFETSNFISSKLSEWGIPHRRIAKTGILSVIESHSNSGSSTVAIRSDHDALPIDEKNDVPYKSKFENKSHMCGHDAHTACNLTAARILWSLRDQFEGTIKILFQPAEEVVLQNGTCGARLMIEDGALQNPIPGSIFAQHVNPFISCGKIGLRSGNIMASVDTIRIKIIAKGGHAALPHLCVDPITIACQTVLSLQQIVSRLANPFEPTVLSFGKISGGFAFNVIPDEVDLLGTLRAYNEEWRSEIHKHIERISKSIATSFNANAICNIEKGVPFLSNDNQLFELTRNAAIQYLGDSNVLLIEPSMTGEDFAVYAQQMPACFYWLGVRNEELGITSGLHTNTMNIDEKALEIGSGFLAYLSICKLIKSR